MVKTLIRTIKWSIKLSVAFLAIYFLASAFVGTFDQATDLEIGLEPSIVLVTALLVFLWLFLYESAWEYVLRNAFEIEVRADRTFTRAAFALSLAYRYIPGKAFLLLARTEYLKRHGLSRTHVAAATLLEQVHFALAPILVFLIATPLFPSSPLSMLEPFRPVLFPLGCALGLALWFAPHVMDPLGARWLRTRLKGHTAYPSLRGPAAWKRSMISHVILGAFQGLLLVPMIAALPAPPLRVSVWVYLITAYPLSRVIGQVGAVTPGGLGIREGAYVFLAGPVLGVQAALILSVGFRVVSMATEALYVVSVLGLAHLRTPQPTGRPAEGAPERHGCGLSESRVPRSDAGGGRPFFLVGCGRSGTTLLRTMLNHHPEVAIPLESLFVIDYLLAEPRQDLHTLKSLLVREYELKEWGMTVSSEELRRFERMSEVIRYLHETYAARFGKPRWGQKTPRFVRFMEELGRAFPDALFVHLVRDPRAVALSLMRSPAHRSNALFAARRWDRDVRAGQDARRTLRDRVLEVAYEDLVLDTEPCLREICRFLGISFDRRMLRYPETGTGEYNDAYYRSLHRKLGDRPDASRIQAWRSSLTQRQQQVIEDICHPTMAAYGYPRETPPGGISMGTKILYHAQRVLGLLLQLAHYVRFRRGYIRSFLRRKVRLGLLRDLRHIHA